ncbi:hypothetical protein [Nocardioides dongkuii]|uniref:hypothetical protein n=1 Tax=Nocardioides dongkuii TaxID=2760089 RepID=UPI0015F7D281|nr:hypothetical protein [Nocardioides dongkuii]
MAKAKFDIKSEATRTLYAGAGVADLAVEALREYVADVQKRLADVQKSVADLDLEPKALRDQALTVVSSRVDALSKDAKARREAIEARVAELQENVATATDAYGDLAQRGQVLVGRIRRQEATKATVSSARTTTAKAKTTRTQAAKATKSTAKSASASAKRTASTTKKAAAKKASTPKSSAKATGTAAKKTASNAAKATSAAASKVGN